MKYKMNIALWTLSLGSLCAVMSSCKKDNSVEAVTGVNGSSIASVGAIAVASLDAGSGTATTGTYRDSIYVMHTCPRGARRDAVAQSALPASINDYVAANYPAAIFQKAYAVHDQTGLTKGYVVIIQYNGKPVGIEFSSAGGFVKVLEQREGSDLDGRGWHNGGRFDDRDGRQKDTVALATLSSVISGYFKQNYPSDTLVKAFNNRDGSIILVSRNNGAFATVFDSAGAFVKRVQLQKHENKIESIDASALPASIQSYISTTYPGYVLKVAFILKPGNTTAGYLVIIDANGTKYALEFDASGAFVKTVAVR